jgi:hypothetical protein
MGKDVVLLFNQYNSTWSDADATNFCYHSSFSDPEAAPDHTPRESIEVRFIVTGLFLSSTPPPRKHVTHLN